MKKRLLSALCAVMLLVCAVPMASAQSGDDTRMADALTVLHILAEEPDRDLTAPATRAQAAVLLVRLSGGEKHPDTDGWFAGFRDVPEWARTAVNRCPPGLGLRRQQRVLCAERRAERRCVVRHAAADAGLHGKGRRF